MEENIESSFLFDGLSEHINDDQCISSDYANLVTENKGVAIGTLMPIPAVRPHPIPNEPFSLPSVPDCRHCSAKKFPYETPKFCCSGGETSLYPTLFPPQLQILYSGFGPNSMHFLQYIKPYNDIFAFTSMGVHLDPVYAKRINGIYTFRAQGQIYHLIDSLYPSGQMPSYLQLYFYDTQKEVENRKADKDKLRPDIISGLIDVLNTKANPQIDHQTAQPPSVSQVAVMWIEDEEVAELNERDILVRKHDGHSQRISHYYGCYDPLQYPLLFLLGEPGWHQGIKKTKPLDALQLSPGQRKISPRHSTTAEQLLANEAAVRETNAGKDSMVSAREFYAYRFQIRRNTNTVLLESGRLLQQYAVDMYVKIETSRLDYFKHRQKEIRADLYQGIVDSVNHGESDASKIGTRVVLPATFIGSPRDMRKRFLDAMALVGRYGKPDLFLTMTCNPNWPEIKAELKPHEEAQNRPDLISRIFKSKFEYLRKIVVKDELFGPVAAYTFAVEFQKRGLPHVHMLLILQTGYRFNTVEKFDAFISAEIPDKNKYPHLYAMVIKHMLHGPCGEQNPQNACMKDEKCKNQYPKNYCTETTVCPDGYPMYRRRPDSRQVKVRGHMLDNRWVIPYNPYLLAMFDCHINVEVCSTIKAVKYLYKYIYKGHDKIIYRLVTTEQNEEINEIRQFQDARWISPPEAMWRIYRFPLYEMRPAVISLHLHLEGRQTINFKDDSNLQSIADNDFLSRTMLTQFFWMNANHEKAKQQRLLYVHFPEEYVWDNQSRSWHERKQKEVIGRIITANPKECERYYLRLLLTHVPGPTSYVHLRTLQGITYPSFRDAATAYGLLEADDSNEKCMEEASAYRMPISLRQLFATILVYCAPTNPAELLFKFEDHMVEDYISIQKLSKETARQQLLAALNSELQSMGKTLKDFQLSHLLTSATNHAPICKEIQDETDLHISEADLQSPSLLNTEQTMAYNQVLDVVFNKKLHCFFIDGLDGTGKTFLYRAILATIRSQRKIALATASSGVAASILPSGWTAHSHFKIPINTDGKLSCHVGKQSGLAALLRETVLIVWDEASMAKKQSIEALDALLHDITENNTLFGGKVVVLGGDFRQVLPVIPKGTKEDCINASLVKSYIWKSLTKLKLTENMHARTDPAFRHYILRIGNGLEPENEIGNIKLPGFLALQPTKVVYPLDLLIQFVFPTISTGDLNLSSLTNSAILTPKNQAVDKINQVITSKFPGKEHTYLCVDETTDLAQQGLYIDFLNSLVPPGMPTHQLILKKNIPVLLLRNINPSKGLCNGTRLICKEFNKHMITAQITGGERKGTTVFIPRIPLQPSDPQQYPVEFTRRQFPIRPCFAMTINKAQGQTLDTVGIYLPEPVFSHGQLYVALSRATAAEKIKIHLRHSEDDPSTYYYTKNVVYKELLQEANCS
ncbi:hypothetical protein RHGRI_038884 [Rhododendron griersonianum]|uniref:ATP-dependent DNA helicase n=1 Tax=Rhododendron griersonianum TaxID=479676 RepID=A0AAV6HHY5_9ERIC|nr:hypothetical protein RHGRI_038884 [Rhododendron griersonianum]